MLRYRAASWLIRTTAPELSLGLISKEEVIDITPTPAQAPFKPIQPENVDTETGEITDPDVDTADVEDFVTTATADEEEDILSERP